MARKAKTDPNGANPKIGRPSKYNQDIPKKMVDWFIEMTKKDGTWLNKTTYIPPKLPTFERFAVFEMDICMDTLQEWRTVYPEFSGAYQKCKAIQKDHLNEYGMNGLYNASYTKFVAMNITDMREKVETKTESKNEIKLSYNLDDD